MAGSRRSPVLRDQWSADHDREPRDRDRRRGRGSHRDRGRGRHRERGRHSRPSDRHFNRPPRSPPSRAFRLGPDSSHPDDFPLDRSPRGSPGPSSSGFRGNRRKDYNRPPSPSGDWNVPPSGSLDREAHPRRDESPFAPPSKRQRTRSPSPRGPRSPFSNSRPKHGQHGERRDRSPSFKKRGRGRGAPRRRSPRRGRDRRGGPRPDIGRRGRSRSPVRGRGFHPSPDRRSRTPSGDGYSDVDSRYRSLSRHSARSANSRLSASPHDQRRDSAMNSTRPIQSIVEGSTRSPSPPRRIPSFDSDRFDDDRNRSGALRDEISSHGMRSFDPHSKPHRRSSIPYSDNRPYAMSPRNGTPSPYQGSPQPHSSYHYHSNQDERDDPSNYPPSHYGGPPQRGGHSGYRGNHPKQGPGRRFSGSGPPPYHNGPSHRGRGHFSNLQWTASGSRGRGGQHSPYHGHNNGSHTPSYPPIASDEQSPWGGESDNYFRAASRDPQREDDQANRRLEGADSQTMPPPGRESDTATPANKSGKFSFTLKSKATPLPSPKPVPDLAQRMQIRQPPPRAPEPPAPRNRLTNGPLPQFKPDSRSDRRDRDRGRNRDRGDRRDFRGSRDFREPRGRRDDRRFDQRRDRRKDDRRPDFRRELPREPSPERPIEPPPKQKKILCRPKPRPTLSEEFAKADSVYYRKPGNESVIGAGTYGKVFKAIHVYTQRKVALKKIRMEGEKDGYPVTAVREIKLLQHLRHHNVVSLLEVMVEDNECFMVFEYLSHDLTGLINHPSFSLTLAHKKDLAKQMFEGLHYLHHRGVLHRDIKAANILVSNRGLLKFADFGLARFFSKSRQLDYTNRVITIWYRPPELLLGETRYGPAVDVWSAACVCMEMFTKKAVFPGEGGELSQLDKLYNSLGTPTRSEWPDLVEMPWFHLMRPTERKKRVFEDQYRDLLTPAALDLISQVFHYDPAKRPSAEEVLQHPYFVSEEPAPQAATELENIQGDWHEFESKALRKEARRVEYQNQKDREKRKAEAPAPAGDRDLKRAKQETSGQALGA